jgi:simple sugar transport system permease protein
MGRRLAIGFIRNVLPLILAIATSGILLLAMGKSPSFFYGEVIRFGLMGSGWQRSLVMLAPLLLYGAGLIVAFRGKLWNLGYEGQYLLGGVLVVGLAPYLTQSLPLVLAFAILMLLGAMAGGAWTFIPAVLKARFGTNEIVTTLMLSFVGIGITNMLIRGPFQNPDVTVPQTQVMPLDTMFPKIPGSKIHIGIIIALIVVLIVHYVLTRTSFGLRLDVYGASPKSALHVGINAPRMVIVLFLASGALIGFAAAVDMLGLWGNMRANWNPAYGSEILPFVFLARLSVLASIPFLAFYAVLATGGALASQDVGLDSHFMLVVVALILMFMSVIEYIGMKRDLGQSYLPPGLRKALASLLTRRKARNP